MKIKFTAFLLIAGMGLAFSLSACGGAGSGSGDYPVLSYNNYYMSSTLSTDSYDDDASDTADDASDGQTTQDSSEEQDASESENLSDDAFKTEILKLLNAARKAENEKKMATNIYKNNPSSVTLLDYFTKGDAWMQTAAQVRAEMLARGEKIKYIRLEQTNSNFEYYYQTTELTSIGPATPEKVVTSWLLNLMLEGEIKNSDYNIVAIGRYIDNNGVVYVDAILLSAAEAIDAGGNT